MGVACSYSSAPDKAYKEKKSRNILTEFRRFFQRLGDHHLGYQFRSTFDHPKMEDNNNNNNNLYFHTR